MADASHLPPQPQPKPSHQADPQRTPRTQPKLPAPVQQGPAGGGQPAQLDTTRTAALVLRDADHEAGAALGVDGPTRQAGLIRAAQKLKAALYEAGALAELDPVVWQELAIELASSLTVVERLRTELLRSGIGSIGQELAQAVERLAPKVGRKEWEAARANDVASVVPKLSTSERMELARGAIAAARLQIAALRQWEPDELRKNAVAAVGPIDVHLGVATDALLVLPLRERFASAADIELLTADLSFLARVLAASPMVKWDRVFASVFDSEHQLRAASGLPRQVRPFSGTVDPQAALRAVTAVSRDDKPRDQGSVTIAYQEPQAAVNGIALEMGYVFDQRLLAIKALDRDLREPPPPKARSSFDTLLDIAVNVALSSVAGALGALVSEKLKAAVERSAKAAVEVQVQREAAHLAADARKALFEDRFQSGALGRAVAVDSVKDASNQLLKDTVIAALGAHRPSGLNAREPLNAFIQQQDKVLVAARQDALRRVSHLATALGQLDLEVLDRFVNELQQIPEQAHERQYDVSLREWENLRARLASEPAGRDKFGDPDLDAPRVNDWGEQPIPGVLEVGLSVGRDVTGPSASLSYLVLRGGEANAIRHLKQHPRKLAEAGLNRQYQLSFLGWEAERSDAHEIAGRPAGFLGVTPSLPTMVKVGVGVRDGFQPGSLRPDELRLLKLCASRDVTALGIVAALTSKRYDAVPDAVALALAKQLIAEVDHVTTARLED